MRRTKSFIILAQISGPVAIGSHTTSMQNGPKLGDHRILFPKTFAICSKEIFPRLGGIVIACHFSGRTGTPARD